MHAKGKQRRGVVDGGGPVIAGRRSARLKGKQRLGLLVVVVAVVVGGLAAIGARAARKPHPAATVAAGSNVNGGTTATPDEIARLKSWGLSAGDLPTGTRLLVGEELRNYAVAAASGSRDLEKQVADEGRVDGYRQQWQQDTAHIQISDSFALYDSPSSAMATLAGSVKSTPAFDINDLPDPKLGNFSRMYSVTSAPQASQKLEGWAIQWVRGRTVLEVNGLGPPGELQSNVLLNAARAIDAKAAKDPIK